MYNLCNLAFYKNEKFVLNEVQKFPKKKQLIAGTENSKISNLKKKYFWRKSCMLISQETSNHNSVEKIGHANFSPVHLIVKKEQNLCEYCQGNLSVNTLLPIVHNTNSKEWYTRSRKMLKVTNCEKTQSYLKD